MDSIDALNELSVLVSSYNYKDPNDRFHYCKYIQAYCIRSWNVRLPSGVERTHDLYSRRMCWPSPSDWTRRPGTRAN